MESLVSSLVREHYSNAVSLRVVPKGLDQQWDSRQQSGGHTGRMFICCTRRVGRTTVTPTGHAEYCTQIAED